MKVALVAALLSTTALASEASAKPKARPDSTPMLGSAPTLNRSPMDRAFQCMSSITSQSPRPLRISVGNIRDYTGKFSNEASEGGFKITQGGSLMVISALGKLQNVDIIERFDTSIAEQEAGLAKSKLIRDPEGSGEVVRGLTAGQYDGSDYYITGGITEVNYNIRSGGAALGISNIGAGKRVFVMNVGADLRLVDAKTLKVVKTIPVQKQIYGVETKAGIFSFFGDYLVDLDAGTKSQEPIQMGVRTALELGTLELLSSVVPNSDYYQNTCRAETLVGFSK